jgi:hypothetical protein
MTVVGQNGRTHSEHKTSGSPPKADIPAANWTLRSRPKLGDDALHVADTDTKLPRDFSDTNSLPPQPNDSGALLGVVVARPA